MARFRNINFLKSVWPLRTEHSSKNYAMNFNLQNIEVISDRNKWKEPCLQGVPNYDEHMYEKMMKDERVGCKPPYWTSKENRSLCSNSSSMRRISNVLLGLRTFVPDDLEHLPCRKLTKLEFDYTEMDQYDRKPLCFLYNRFRYNKKPSRYNMTRSKMGQSVFEINIWFSTLRYREVS